MDTLFNMTMQPLDSMPCLAVAFLIWGVEAWRRSGPAATGAYAGRLADSGKSLLSAYAPEAVSLTVCGALAVVSCIHSSHQWQLHLESDPRLAELVAQVERDWPLLKTADSLLAIQAVVRLLLLLSAVLRSGGCMPLAGEGAALLLGAAGCRVACELSPMHKVEGPMGGSVHLAFELAALPLLAGLTLVGMRSGTAQSFRALTVVTTAASAVWMGARNRLMLTEADHMDAAFTAAHFLEFWAAVAFLLRTLGSPWSADAPFPSLVHMLLPLQQALSWYFIVFAFEASESGLGPGLKVLQVVGGVQLCVLAWAALAHCALGAEGATPGMRL